MLLQPDWVLDEEAEIICCRLRRTERRIFGSVDFCGAGHADMDLAEVSGNVPARTIRAVAICGSSPNGRSSAGSGKRRSISNDGLGRFTANSVNICSLMSVSAQAQHICS